MPGNRVTPIIALAFSFALAFPTLTKAQGTITPISFLPSSNSSTTTDVGNGLRISIQCHDGGQPNSATTLNFFNAGPNFATLNAFFSNGTTVTANGIFQPAPQVETNPEDVYHASFIHTQIEGQFIFANPTGVTTVKLHAFDGNSFCEIRGTAEFAPIQ